MGQLQLGNPVNLGLEDDDQNDGTGGLYLSKPTALKQVMASDRPVYTSPRAPSESAAIVAQQSQPVVVPAAVPPSPAAQQDESMPTLGAFFGASAPVRAAATPDRPKGDSSDEMPQFSAWLPQRQRPVESEAQTKPADSSDTARGFTKAFREVPPLAKGAVGLVGATGEKAFGEGGIFTSLKKYGLEGYQQGMASIGESAKDTDDLTTAWDKAKQGDLGALVDWAQYGLGYMGGNVAQAAVTSMLGAAAGGAAAGPAGAAAGAAEGAASGGAVRGVVKNLIEGMVAKEAARIAEKSGAGAVTDDITKQATKEVAKGIGSATALAGDSIIKETGGIYGEAEEQARKDGRQLDAGDLARIWGAGIVAGLSEAAVDKLGLDTVAGKIKIPGGGRAGRALIGGAMGAGIEGGQELLQTAIERYGAGQPMTGADAMSDYINSAALGALGGGSVAAVVGAFRDGKIDRPRAEQIIADAQKDMDSDNGRQELFDSMSQDEQMKHLLVQNGIESGADPRFQSVLMKAFATQNLLTSIEIPDHGERAATTKRRGEDVRAAFGDTASTGTGIGTGAMTPVIRRDTVTPNPNEHTLEGDAKPALLPGHGLTPAMSPEDMVAAQGGWKVAPLKQDGTAVNNSFVTLPQAETFLRGPKDKATGQRVGGYASQHPDTEFQIRQGKRSKEAGGGTFHFIESRPLAATATEQAQQTTEQAKSVEQSVQAAADEAATSPNNALPEPTDAQKQSGNYKKGHFRWEGMDLAIENPKDSVRSGTSPDGTAWQTTMAHHYGYVKGTVGKDKDHVDFFMGPNPESKKVFVVDQTNKDGSFDEHKAMLGFNTIEEARAGYLANYEPGWTGLGAISEMPASAFKSWAKDGTKGKPVALEPKGGRQAAQHEAAPVPVKQEKAAPVKQRAQEKVAPAQVRREAMELWEDNDDGKVAHIPFVKLSKEAQADWVAAYHPDDGERPYATAELHDEIVEREARNQRKERSNKKAAENRAQAEKSGEADFSRKPETERPARTFAYSDLKTVDDLTTAVRSMQRARGEPDTFNAARVPISDIVRRFVGIGIAERAASVFGKKIVFFRVTQGEDFFDGSVLNGSGTIFINVNSSHAHIRIVGHELVHALRSTDPHTYQRLVHELLPMLDEGGMFEYAIKQARSGVKGVDKILEEAIGDIVGDRFAETEFWRMLADENPTMFQKLAAAAMKFIDGVLAKLHGRDTMGSQTLIDDLRLARERIASVLAHANDTIARAVPQEERTEAHAEEPAFSRSPGTREQYDARIDDLFAGAKAKAGTRILDSSDVMGLLGYPKVPLMLNESHLRDGLTNHPEMTAAAWKKVPEWIENPAAVYTDPRHPGRLMVIAPQALAGYPVVMSIEPNPNPASSAPRSATATESLLVTAYAKTTGKLPYPLGLSATGNLLYVDMKNAPEVWRRGGGQFPKQAAQLRGRGKILTEKNLAGYRKAEQDQGDLPAAPKQPDDGAAFSRKLDGHPTFYSALERAARAAKQEVAPAKDWVSIISSLPGVKKEEIKWSGVDDWLTLKGNEKITKQQVLEFIDGNRTHLNDIIITAGKGALSEEELRELVEQAGEDPESMTRDEMVDTVSAFYGWKRKTIGEARHRQYTLDGGDESTYTELVLVDPSVAPYKHADRTHFGDVSDGRAIGWLRSIVRKDTDGNDVLFLEELQSQRGQDAREKGFTSEGGEVPDAPFVKDTKAWTSLLMKRAIAYAQSLGIDRISWTHGDQQVERYKLSKQIDSVVYVKNKRTGLTTISAMKGGRTLIDKEVPQKEVSGLLGKSVAEQIDHNHGVELDNEHETSGIISGLDLDIGGDGLRNYYNSIVPSVAKSIVGKDAVRLMHIEQTGDQLGFVVPESVQRQVEEDGLPLFSRKDYASQFGDLDPRTQEIALTKGHFSPPGIADRLRAMLPNLRKRMVQATFDRFHSVKDVSLKAYMMLRLSSGPQDGAVSTLLHYGQVFNDDGALNIKKGTKGLIDILKPLGKETDRFLLWVASNRAEGLAKEDRERFFSPEEIKALKALDKNSMPDGQSRYAVYRHTLQQMNELNRSVLDVARQAGLIDTDAYKRFAADIWYVPFYRQMEEDGTLAAANNSSAAVGQYLSKKLKGSERPLNDLMENVLMNWSHILSASMKNQAAVETLTSASRMGDVVSRVAPVDSQYGKDKDGNTIPLKHTVKVMEDGKTVHYRIDDEFLLASLDAVNSVANSGIFLNIGRHFKTTLTRFVSLSPTFKINNLIRDSVQSIGLSELKKNPVANVIEGWRAYHGDRAPALAGGGLFAMGNAFDGDRAANVKRLIKAGVSNDDILNTQDKVSAFFAKYWHKYDEFSDSMENANRIALYNQLREKGASHLEAAYAARDLQDFTLQGGAAAIRYLSQVLPYFNARLQGMYKIGRDGLDPIVQSLSGKASAAEREKAQKFATVLGAITLFGVLLYLSQKDDPDYDKLEEWERDSFFWFKVPGTQKAFRIPKPFEMGAFETIVERFTEQIVNDGVEGKVFARRLGAVLTDNLAINPVPQVVRPLLDVWQNTDGFTGRPIESMGMERLSPENRVNPGTSSAAVGLGGINSLLAHAAESVTGGMVNAQKAQLSPIQYDYLLRNYLGWVGTGIQTVSSIATAAFTPGESSRYERIDDFMVVGNYIKTLPAAQSKYVTSFYQNAQASAMAVADMQNFINLGQMERAQEMARESGDQLVLNKLYSRAEKTMSALGKQIKVVEGDGKMPGDQKRLEIERLQQLRVDYARQVEQMRAKTARASQQRAFADGGEVSGSGIAPYGLRYTESVEDPWEAKGKGFFGEPAREDGSVSTEISASNDQGSYPLLVPTLNRKEVNLLLSGGKPTDAIYEKAEGHAAQRRALGRSPFAEPGDLRHPLPDN